MSPRVGVVDYGIGNLRSAEKALEHLGVDARLCTTPAEVDAADVVVLPGVGSFGRCVAEIDARGLRESCVAAASDGRPFLGICVGLQLLFESSAESPGAVGLGVLEGEVARIATDLPLPQMQWNLTKGRGGGALAAAAAGRYFYYVHSYVAPRSAPAAATCDYGGELVAALQDGPLWAVQFHPEKSGRAGLDFLAAFVAQAVA